MKIGPSVTALTHRLLSIPGDFIVYQENTGILDISPVVSDLLLSLGQPALSQQESEHFKAAGQTAEAKGLRILLCVCYLLDDPWFHGQSWGGEIRECLSHEWFRELAKIQAPGVFIQDSLRREELVRIVLNLLEIQPREETAEHSQDRLRTLDSLEEKSILQQSQAARKRVQEIREALARKAAEEAASKMSRE